MLELRDDSVRCRSVKIGIEAPRCIPIVREELGPADSPPAPAAPDRGHPLDILLVEDDDDHARIIEYAVRGGRAADLRRTVRGDDALRLLPEDPAGADHVGHANANGDGHGHGTGHVADGGPGRRPDLVLRDFHLPDMSGLDVLQAIRARSHLCTTPFVILTCNESRRDDERCMAAGANAFIVKSADFEAFERSVRRVADFWSETRRPARRPA